jgi:hypothetical protein
MNKAWGLTTFFAPQPAMDMADIEAKKAVCPLAFVRVVSQPLFLSRTSAVVQPCNQKTFSAPFRRLRIRR